MVFRIGVFLCVMLIALCLSGCEKDDLEEEHGMSFALRIMAGWQAEFLTFRNINY